MWENSHKIPFLESVPMEGRDLCAIRVKSECGAAMLIIVYLILSSTNKDHILQLCVCVHVYLCVYTCVHIFVMLLCIAKVSDGAQARISGPQDT